MKKTGKQLAAVLAAAMLITACGNAGAGQAGAAGKGAASETAESEAAGAGASGTETAQEKAESADTQKNGGSGKAAAEGDTEIKEVPFDELFRSFELTDVDGNAVTQDIFKDYDLTLVNIWATFCNPCLQEMPDLGKLNKEYQDAGKRFQVVGLVMDAVSVSSDGKLIAKDEDMIEKAKELIAQTGADYTHIVPEGSFAYNLMMSGEAQSVPTSVFVDSEGNVVGRTVIGARSADNWRAIIDERLSDAASGGA